jgi:hypothetical protein
MWFEDLVGGPYSARLNNLPTVIVGERQSVFERYTNAWTVLQLWRKEDMQMEPELRECSYGLVRKQNKFRRSHFHFLVNKYFFYKSIGVSTQWYCARLVSYLIQVLRKTEAYCADVSDNFHMAKSTKLAVSRHSCKCTSEVPGGFWTGFCEHSNVLLGSVKGKFSCAELPNDSASWS